MCQVLGRQKGTNEIVFALMEALTMKSRKPSWRGGAGAFCFSVSTGEQLSLVPPREPGKQRHDSALLSEHLFFYRAPSPLGLVLHLSQASGLGPWAAVPPCLLPSILPSFLSPLLLGIGHGSQSWLATHSPEESPQSTGPI